MSDLETLARKAAELDLRKDALESELAQVKRDRQDVLKNLHDELLTAGIRTVRVDGLVVTVAAEYRWMTSVRQGVDWALRKGHHGVLTILEREFSDKVAEFVKQGHNPPPWIKRWPVLRLTVTPEQDRNGSA